MNIDTAGIDTLIAKLSKLDASTFRAIMLRIGARLGLKLEELISLYPDAKKRSRAAVYQRTRADGTVYLSKFKSQKQQNYVGWLFSSGKIPYKRTGLLGRSLNSSARLAGADVLVSIGSSVLYAPYVIGSEGEQALIHQNYWTPLVEDVQNSLPEVTALAEREFNNAVNAYFI